MPTHSDTFTAIQTSFSSMGASSSSIDIVFVEGNIGCGKSSALNWLKQNGFTVITENADEWVFLEKFYTNPAYAFQLQTEIAVSMKNKISETLKTASPGDTIFIERSILTCNLFAQVQFNSLSAHTNHIPEQLAVLRTLYDTLHAPLKSEIFQLYTIYLSLSPDVCYDRIKVRNRPAEKMIELDYLHQLHNTFENTFSEKKPNLATIPLDPAWSIQKVGSSIYNTFKQMFQDSHV